MGLSGNLTILSSIDGQYRGPVLVICPLYMGERFTFSAMMRRVSASCGDVARHLRLRDLLCAEAERSGISVAGLDFKLCPIDRAAVEARRRSCL